MKLELEIYGTLCETAVFTINDIKADAADFGTKGDISPVSAEDYGCGDMCFQRVEPTDEILTKYGITLAEYALIASQLEEGLSFGCCGWCV